MNDKKPVFSVLEEEKMLVSCAIHLPRLIPPKPHVPIIPTWLFPHPTLVILLHVSFGLLSEARPIPPVLSPSLQFWRSSSSMEEPACCSRLAGDVNDR